MTNQHRRALSSKLEYCEDCGRCYNTQVVNHCPECADYTEVGN